MVFRRSGDGGVESEYGGWSAGMWPYQRAVDSKDKRSNGERFYAKTEMVLSRHRILQPLDQRPIYTA